MGGRPHVWLWLLVGTAILTQTTLNLVRPTVSYQLLGMGADAGTVGLVTSAYALLPLVLVMWLGRLTERTPRLSALIAVGAVVFAASCLLLAYATTIVVVAIGSVVLGVAHIVFTIAGQASIARYMPPEDLDRGFGWFTAGYAVGQLLGPLLGGLMLGSDTDLDARTTAIRTTMLVGAAVSLVALPVIAPLVFGFARPYRGGAGRAEAPQDDVPEAGVPDGGVSEDGVPEAGSSDGGAAEGGVTEVGVSHRGGAGGPEGASATEGPPVGKPTMLRILRLPTIPSHMIASLALLTMADLLIAFLPVVGERHGVAPVWVGVFLAVRAGATIASRICLPWLSARYRRSDLVIVSLLGAGVTIVATPSTLTWPVVTIILMAVGGFFLGLGQPLTMTLVVQSVPTAWRSTALAVRLMGNRMGQVVIPLAAGGIAWAVGPAGAIWFASLLLVVSGAEKSLHRRAGGFRR